jgi:hypothetical protein
VDIRTATADYEHWLGTHTSLVNSDLKIKHARMASDHSPFPFFRATFYRWAQRLAKVCPEVMDSPPVLGVGDLHVENFGTWRDAEGRLVYGVNDFDEACELPYTADLVRLAVSAALASRELHLALPTRQICETILEGYASGIEARLQGTAAPVVISDKYHWLVPMVLPRDPARFWACLRELPVAGEPVPSAAMAALKSVLPDPHLVFRLCSRTAGVGSLGRRRICALAEWNGGPIAREAKAVAPSACHWAGYAGSVSSSLAGRAEAGAVRARDPFYRVVGLWIVRRLAPDCEKITLAAADTLGQDRRLLRLMGRETANVHGCDADQLKTIRSDLKDRPERWLRDAAKSMIREVLEDWESWRAQPVK